MASIKVSELPSVTSITPNDVLIINDEDLITSSITISLFTSSFTGQNLEFTGTAQFFQPVTFSTSSLPTFNTETVFNQRVTFTGPITLGPLAAIPLGSLSNVTLDNSVPDGQVLAYDSTLNIWKNEPNGTWGSLVEDTTPQLGGNLDTNGYSIVTAAVNEGAGGSDITIDPNGGGVVKFAGNATKGAGQFQLMCETGDHGVTIKGPPHSAQADYTFTFPVNMGTNLQVLTTNGTATTSWTTITAAGIGAATAAQGAKADTAMQKDGNNGLINYTDNAAAAAGGVPVGGLYQTSGTVKVRV